MRIVHVVHTFLPRTGGIENAVYWLAREQAALGHEVHVVTAQIPGAPREEEIGGVRVHRIRAVKLWYPDLTAPREAPRELLKSADVVHAHSQNSLFSVRLAQEAKRLGAKVAFHLMALEALRDHPNPLVRVLGTRYARRNARAAIEAADVLLARSIRDQELARRIYGAEAHYLPDAVPDYYLTRPRADPQEFKKRYGIGQEKMVLYIGRIHKLKGPHILVEAMRHVEGAAAALIGPDDGYLKAVTRLVERLGLQERVYVLGRVDEDAKIQALDAADALVLPSISDYVEVYPMVISEAWARGRPVIASRVGGIPYRIIHGVNGLLVDPRDPKALAEAITYILNNPEAAERMGQEGRKNISTWREIAKRSIELYNLT